jgi:hypothetical protein
MLLWPGGVKGGGSATCRPAAAGPPGPLPVVLLVGIAVPTYPAAVAAGSILLRSNLAADSRGWAVVVLVGGYLAVSAVVSAG